ncbi:MAG: Rpn family recombination-promoting nuclease/putative transposase [Desulfobacterales bacterium]|nr:Rpn family recombination-promoting nuclease/putative transposase [Desulfobacterales bacterium]
MKNPHDKFFKETLTRRENALSFFREYLPADIAAKLDWRTLKITKETFVEPELRERFSDILYEILAKGRQVFIYLLLEHQSAVDVRMSLRLLGYIVRIWELYCKQNPEAEKLPGIVPVVFYHGREKWDVSVQFGDLIDAPELTAGFIPDFKYLLKDFSPAGNEEIKGSIMLRLFLNLTGRIFSPDFAEHFERMIPLFAELSQKKTGMQYIETVLRYICHASDALTWKDMETRLIQAFEEDRKGVIMTIAEELEMKGEIKAYQELMDSGIIPRESAGQKIAELTKKLENACFQFQNRAADNQADHNAIPS